MASTPSRAFSTPVKNGDVDAIRAAAAAGTPLEGLVDSLPRHRYTPLTLAVEVKQLDSVNALLDLGADIDAADQMGRTPLEAAFIAGGSRDRARTIAIVEVLVARGAKVSADALDSVRNTHDAYGDPAYPGSLITMLEKAADSEVAR